MNENYDEWMNKEADDQIRDLMMNKDQEDRMEVEKRKRMEKAKVRKKLWKEWRNETTDDERDQVLDDDEDEGAEEGVVQAHHPGEAELLTNIGEEEPVSSHIHQGDEPEQPAHKEENRMEPDACYEGLKEHAEEVHHQGEAVGEPPGQDSSLHKAGVLSEILGGEKPGWGGRMRKPL